VSPGPNGEELGASDNKKGPSVGGLFGSQTHTHPSIKINCHLVKVYLLCQVSFTYR